MNERLIELGLRNENDRNHQQTDANSTYGWGPLTARLMHLLSATAVESTTLKTDEFRTRLQGFRTRLESSIDGDPETLKIANECLQLCDDYLHRSRTYLFDREREFLEVIDVMRIALNKLAGESKAFSTRLMGNSDRIHRLTEIEDIRELKRRIYQEVEDLNRIVTEKQKQDEGQYTKLSKRIEVLQASLTYSKMEASIDMLTRIPNRSSLDRTLERWITEHKQARKPFLLAILDIDNFKQINDTQGHQVGDRVLFCAAQLLVKWTSSNDFVARYGGEEFMVMLGDTEPSEAEVRFAALLEDIGGSNYVYVKDEKECSVRFTASCGLAEFSVDESAEDLIRRADEALYLAKKMGRNRVVLAKSQKSLWKTLTSPILPRPTKERP
jgi:diguanylate cyclase (GGDEF)-like protein